MSLRGHYRAEPTHEQGISFLVVCFGETRLALPAEGVRGELTSGQAGVGDAIRAGGRSQRQIDLAGPLSFPADFNARDTRVVLYSNGRSHAGVRVEQVFGLTEVEPSQCVPLPAHFRGDERTWFAAMFLHERGLALVVNPTWLLGEMAEVVSVASGGMSSQSAPQIVEGGGSC